MWDIRNALLPKEIVWDYEGWCCTILQWVCVYWYLDWMGLSHLGLNKQTSFLQGRKSKSNLTFLCVCLFFSINLVFVFSSSQFSYFNYRYFNAYIWSKDKKSFTRFLESAQVPTGRKKNPIIRHTGNLLLMDPFVSPYCCPIALTSSIPFSCHDAFQKAKHYWVLVSHTDAN